ncbi:Similar to Hit family protein 1; acc. no. O94586 [Pyronema omphalodes CBS 100304]|uniref:Similar to Hit family protein 1 acc. no. O94586 n=1 Tax=Pyronema omphalodes (strain CBS 100304) TaxID=1076935 RepID=U4KX63_PYROM|nr:Similar to Hit family protein 1; acc. no. O94586 [Pyronema omphalodes CBS 100304]
MSLAPPKPSTSSVSTPNPATVPSAKSPTTTLRSLPQIPIPTHHPHFPLTSPNPTSSYQPPKSHYEKLTDLPSSINASIGAWLPIIARAACAVSGYADFNVVQNNGINAAQVVPHVHYHIIPRPDERQREELEKKVPREFKKWWKSPFGSGWRVELDEEEAKEMVGKLRTEVGRLAELEKKREGKSVL